MTLKELIDKVAEEKPNTFSNDKLTDFLNETEAEVAEQLGISFRKYSWMTNQNTKLLARQPYDRLYVSYLKAMIDYANEEYESYQNNQAQHVQDFRDFTDFVVRDGAGKSNTVTRLKNTMW